MNIGTARNGSFATVIRLVKFIHNIRRFCSTRNVISLVKLNGYIFSFTYKNVQFIWEKIFVRGVLSVWGGRFTERVSIKNVNVSLHVFIVEFF